MSPLAPFLGASMGMMLLLISYRCFESVAPKDPHGFDIMLIMLGMAVGFLAVVTIVMSFVVLIHVVIRSAGLDLKKYFT